MKAGVVWYREQAPCPTSGCDCMYSAAVYLDPGQSALTIRYAVRFGTGSCAPACSTGGAVWQGAALLVCLEHEQAGPYAVTHATTQQLCAASRNSCHAEPHTSPPTPPLLPPAATNTSHRSQLLVPEYRAFLSYMCPGYEERGVFPPIGTDPAQCRYMLSGVYDDHDSGWNNGDSRCGGGARGRRAGEVSLCVCAWATEQQQQQQRLVV
jgi:hypothetical protein